MYIVEGNIGVGKSTFLSLVKKHLPHIDIFLEPQENWSNEVYGQSLLSNFYQDPQRWAYTLETLAMICRARYHDQYQQHHHPNYLIERSIYSGHYCFAYNDKAQKFFTDLEWEIYQQWAHFFIEERCQLPLGFIYLKADPKTCFSRVQKRSRSSETALTLEYLEQIDYWHDQFLIKKENLFEDLKKVPVLTLNCDDDFEKSGDVLNEHHQQITDFFRKTQPSLIGAQKTTNSGKIRTLEKALKKL